MFTKITYKSNVRLRHERKYALTPGVYEVLRRRAGAVMRRDSHSTGEGYRITSLYFDDAYRTAYWDKLNGVLSRRKFRIRTYNLSPEHITLEGKHKEGSYVYKTGARITHEEYKSILAGDLGFCHEREDMQAFLTGARNADLRPAVIVDYFREAYVEKAGNVRITFDKNISAGFGASDMFAAEYSPAPFGLMTRYIVLEVKYDDFIPAYIQELFTGFALVEEPISKFVICTEKQLEVNKRWVI